MDRRRFAFWLGFGLFNLGEKLNAAGFDLLAASAMQSVGRRKRGPQASSTPTIPVHWTADEDQNWKWYERESWIDGVWIQTGITAPVNKQTGERKTEPGGYLDDRLLPEDLRPSEGATDAEPAATDKKPPQQLPTAKRRSRHGRPPSQWLRSLEAEELSIWLTTIETQEAGVSGMTYFEHLTRDHSFDADKIEGLTEEELAKLHGAAHFGY